jgi:transcriptional regulator with XRE-family HTH domain
MKERLSNSELSDFKKNISSIEITQFGEKLRSLRVHYGITLAQLSHILEYHTHSYLSEVESGKKAPTVNLVIKVARLFSVTIDELLKDEIAIDLNKSKLINNLME